MTVAPREGDRSLRGTPPPNDPAPSGRPEGQRSAGPPPGPTPAHAGPPPGPTSPPHTGPPPGPTPGHASPPPGPTSPPHTGPPRSGWPRLATLLALIAALAIGGYALPLRRVPDAIGHLGAVAPLAGVTAGALLLCALIPRTAVSLACGLLFGALGGGVIALVAAVLAACATFAIGRALGREAVVALERVRGTRGVRASRSRGSCDGCGTRSTPDNSTPDINASNARGASPDRIARLDAWLARRGWWGVTLVRMMPLAPFGLIGYAYGTTSVRWRNYLCGTAIGATPSAFSYAGLGAAVTHPDAVRWLTFAPATVGLLVAAATFVYWRRCQPLRDGDRLPWHPMTKYRRQMPR